MEGTRTYYDSEDTRRGARRHETRREAELVHKGQQPLISETTVNTGDKIETRQYEIR